MGRVFDEEEDEEEEGWREGSTRLRTLTRK